MTTVALDYLDWSVCAGGKHLTAHIVISEPYKRIELERGLSLREAKELRPDHSESVYEDPYFRRTHRFDSFDQLVRAATKWCEANLTAPWTLQEYSSDGLRKVLALAGVSETRVRVLNSIAEKWDRLSNVERDRETMDAFYAAWRAWKPA